MNFLVPKRYLLCSIISVMLNRELGILTCFKYSLHIYKTGLLIYRVIISENQFVLLLANASFHFRTIRVIGIR